MSEIGNPRYNSLPQMVDYDPEVGALVYGRKKQAELKPTDLIEIPHHLGHISIAQALGDKAKVFSEQEFNAKVYQLYDQLNNKVRIIENLARVSKIDPRRVDLLSRSINEVARSNPHFTPQQLFDQMVAELEWTIGIPVGDLEGKIKACGVFSLDEATFRHGLPAYFYLYCQMGGFDGSNVESISQALEHFGLYEELVNEFKDHPDSRFGDSLLVALDREVRQIREHEQAEENPTKKHD